MSFEEVREYLLLNLFAQLPQDLQEKAKIWIEALGPSDESDLLGYCLAIDLESGSLTISVLELIFRELRDSFNSPRREFAYAVEQCSETLRLRSQHRAETTSQNPKAYANVLDLTAFLQCYLIPSYPYLTPDDLARARAEFFGQRNDASISQECTLEEIEGSFEGPDGIVWVGPDSAYRSRTSELGPGAATQLHDILGLGEGWRGEMVYIKYPPGFEPPDCVQPSSIDNRWDRAGGCYLSAAEGDRWGRTQSRSGSSEPVQERIHGPINSLTEEFTARLMTEPTIKPRDVRAFREAALERFRQVVGGRRL